jgi:hypothetical protein
MTDPFVAPNITDVQEQDEGKAHDERMAKWLFTVLIVGALAAVILWKSREPRHVFVSPAYFLEVDEDGNYSWVPAD